MGYDGMKNIDFPHDFPDMDALKSILHKTIDKSWRNDIDANDIEQWLNNFTGLLYNVDDERRIALWLLCNYTFYNSDDVNHLCKILYSNFIHDITIRNSFKTTEEIINCIKNSFFSSIGSAGESGGLLLYHFRQEANISIDRFFYPSAINSTNNDTIVFIDDVTISGGTAARFFHQNISSMSYKNIYYLTIIASLDAVNKLSDLGITVIFCSLIDERNQCFSERSMAFYKFPTLRENSREIAYEYGKLIEPNKPLGHKGGQFAFGFYYNTPNNTLPIFWSCNNWTPIFPRKEKLQNVNQCRFDLNRFI